MAEREGVINFDLDFVCSPCLVWGQVRELSSWRILLHRLQIIGQDPARYGGYGFGNISVRHSQNPGQFIITGSQTGGTERLSPSDFALVRECNPYINTIVAEGETRPSSESLTHGQLYQLFDAVQCVVHVHSPDIWNSAASLGLQSTSPEILYGTPEMAFAVTDLLAGVEHRHLSEGYVFTMGGHEDGVVSFGRSVEESCVALIRLLGRAVSFDQAG